MSLPTLEQRINSLAVAIGADIKQLREAYNINVTSHVDVNPLVIDVDAADLAVWDYTLASGTIDLAAPTGTPKNGQRLMIRITTANQQTFGWHTSFVGSSDLPLPLATTGLNKTDYLGFIFNDASGKWQLIAKNFGF